MAKKVTGIIKLQIPAGKATIAIPTIADTTAKNLPTSDTGVISPYPIVARAVVDQYIASKKV